MAIRNLRFKRFAPDQNPINESTNYFALSGGRNGTESIKKNSRMDEGLFEKVRGNPRCRTRVATMGVPRI